jgi:L-amino acid N-acyltransferase YncA
MTLEGTTLLNAPNLRECREEDIPHVTAIYRHAVLHGYATFEIDPPDATEMQARRMRLVAGQYPYIVAEAAGEVVGYAYAGAYHQRAAFRATVENSIYVREGFQGRGIGDSLLRLLIDKSTAAGFRQMVAVIGDSGNIGSIRLHEKHGFVLVGTLRDVGYKKNRWLDVVIMQRGL